MVARNKILFFVSNLLVMSLFTGCVNKTKNVNSVSKEKKLNIGISQIAEHPALDLSRKGFIEALEHKGFKEGENLHLEFQNAQGDIATAQLIAQSFISQKKDLIFAIGTPAAQTIYNSTKHIPLIVTAVTDGVEAGIVKSKERSETNVAGTSDAAPMEKQMQLAKALIPRAKTLGVLYNTSEVNSEVQIERLTKAAKEQDLEIKTTGVNSINEISQALDSIINQVDFLYILTDNLIASSMALISSKAIEKNKPIIGAEEGHVVAGALATDGIDYYKLGFEAGDRAIEVLQGKDIKSMCLGEIKDTQIVINETVAEKLNIKIPEQIKNNAKLIKEVQ